MIDSTGNFSSEVPNSHIRSIPFSLAEFSARMQACFIVGDRNGLSSEQLHISDLVVHYDCPGLNRTTETMIGYEAKISICLQQFCTVNLCIPREKDLEKNKHMLGKVDEKHVKTVRYAQTLLKGAPKNIFEEDNISNSNILHELFLT